MKFLSDLIDWVYCTNCIINNIHVCSLMSEVRKLQVDDAIDKLIVKL